MIGREVKRNAVAPLPWGASSNPVGEGENDEEEAATPRVDVLRRRATAPAFGQGSHAPSMRRPLHNQWVDPGTQSSQVAAAQDRLKDLEKQMDRLNELGLTLKAARSSDGSSGSSRLDASPVRRAHTSMPRYKAAGMWNSQDSHHSSSGSDRDKWGRRQEGDSSRSHGSDGSGDSRRTRGGGHSHGSRGSRGGRNPMSEHEEDDGLNLSPEDFREAVRQQLRGAFAVTLPQDDASAPPRTVQFMDQAQTLPGATEQVQLNPNDTTGQSSSNLPSGDPSNGYLYPPTGIYPYTPNGYSYPPNSYGYPVNGYSYPANGYPQASNGMLLPPPEEPCWNPFLPMGVQKIGWVKEEGDKAKDSKKEDEEEANAREQHKHGHRRKHRPNHTLQEATPVSLNLLFGGFTQKSPFRMKCFQIQKSSSWAGFFLCVTLANVLSIGIADVEEAEGEGRALDSPTSGQLFDYACVMILLFECMCGWVAIGLFESPTTWFRVNNYNKLDFVVLVVTITEFIAGLFGLRGLTLRPFRLLRVFRAITRVKMFGGVKSIMNTLSRGLGQLLTVFAMLMFFMVAFSICGMAIYGTSFRRRCVTLGRPVPACSSDFSSGWTPQCDLVEDRYATKLADFGTVVVSDGYPWEQFCKIYKTLEKSEENDTRYPWDPEQQKYHSCQIDEFLAGQEVWQTCVDVGNPMYGLSHFDHIGGAFVSIFQGAAPDGYYDIIHRSLMSEPDASPITLILYFCVTCICTFLLLGLFVAVITGTFKQVREAEGKSSFVAQDNVFDDDDADEDWLDHGKFARNSLNVNVQSKEEQEVADNQAEMQKSASIKNLMARGARSLVKMFEQKERERKDDEDEDGGAVMRKFCADIKGSVWRTRVVSLAILCHCGAMAVYQHDATADIIRFAMTAFYSCNAFFICDLVLVFLSCYDFGDFWGSSKNRLEVLLVVTGVIGLASGQKILMLLPGMRLYYIMVYFPTLQHILDSAISSTAAILNLVVFISIVALCFAIAGRYIFKTEMGAFTRSNFSTFPNALLTIFQLLTGDSWSAVMYSAMASKTSILGQAFACAFILSWFTFANLIVKNLFVAVIIENFEVAETIENIRKPGYVTTVRGMLRDAYHALYLQSLAFRSQQVEIDVNTGMLVAKKKLEYKFAKEMRGKHGEKRMPMDYGTKRNAQNELISQVAVTVETIERDEEEEEREVVLGCFGPQNSIRHFFVWLGKQPWFDLIVYSAIIISCVFLMLAPPNDELNATEGVLDLSKTAIANTFFTCIFTMEFLTKVMAQGLFFTKYAYLKSGWNIMDSVVLVFAWIDETGFMAQSGMAKVARLARALRPLRLMKRNHGMRIVIDALIRTLAPVVYVILFQVFTFIVFALIGMGLFGGQQFRCTTPGAEYPRGMESCSGNHVSDGSIPWGMSNAAPAGVLVPRAWITPPYNFDNIYRSCFTLYRVNTIKYVSVIYDSMDVTGPNTSNLQDANQTYSLFVVVYLVVGGLFVMNLFVGFIVDGFNANKGASQAEIHYNRFIMLVSKNKPKHEYFTTPQNPISSALRVVATSKAFQSFSATCVIINVLFMLADHSDPSPAFSDLLNTQNDIFFAELIVEIALYFSAYGAGGFVNDLWKMFDLFVCLGTMTGYAQNNDKLAQFAKSFRLMRVVRLMKMFRPIRIILETMLSSLPQLANILLLILLVYSMFAVVAVSTFGTIKYGRRLGPTANFESFPRALLTCYQMVTGDEWMDITDDCEVDLPACTYMFSKEYVYGWTGKDHTYGDCGSSAAIPFFMTFKLVCESVMLNLFIGMILDNFSFITDEVAHVEDSEWTQGASSAQVQDLARCFMEFDCGKSFVPLNSLHALMCTMKQPLGYKNMNNEVEFGEAEKTAEKLVRAELNIILRAEAEARMHLSWWQRKSSRFRKRNKFNCAIGFANLCQTLLFWRLPSSVPHFLKVLRQPRVEEVVLMAQAITITDFFHMLVSRRWQAQTRVSMSQRILFRSWSVRDPHHTRRVREILAIKRKERQKAKQRRHPWQRLLVQPAGFAYIDFHPLDFLPAGHKLHNDFLTDLRAPKPTMGLDVFLEKSATMFTVLKFIDTRNEKKGLVLAAFEKELFMGWHRINLSNDTLFAPKRRKNRTEHRSEPWVKLDCRMRSREVDRRGNRLNRWKEVGVLLDVQSFVVQDGLDAHGRPQKPLSVVRINIGTMQDIQQSAEDEGGKKDKNMWHDGVMEVVGYVNTTLEEVELERLAKEQAERDAGRQEDGEQDMSYVRYAA